jgi:hypothetical protein
MPIVNSFPYVQWLTPCKKKKESKLGKERQSGKNCSGALKKRKERFQDPCSIPILVRRGLVVNLVSKFWGHDEAYESNHFLEQMRRRRMTTTSTSNKTTKVKRPREGGFCFVVGLFFFMFLSSPKTYLSPRIWLLPTN